MSDQGERLMFFNSINVFRWPGKKFRDEIFYRRNFTPTSFLPIRQPIQTVFLRQHQQIHVPPATKISATLFVQIKNN